MRLIRTRKGQSMAEYAVLFAIVIGAAVAMQQYVKGRLQATVRAKADGYMTAAGMTATASYDPTRYTKSSSGTDLEFDDARKGKVTSTSGSRSGIDKSKNQ